MNPDDFLSFISKSKEELEASEKKYKLFTKAFCSDLFETSFNYYEELKTRKARLAPGMKACYETCATNAFNALASALYYKRDQLPYDEPVDIPKPQSKEEAGKHFQELLKDIPQALHANAFEVFWESYEEEAQHEQFISQIHQQIKKTLTDFYYDEIIGLDSGHLRLLENYIYYLSTSPFIEEFYTKTEN